MNSTTIAIDVAKSVFEVAVSEQPGQVRERQRLSREVAHERSGSPDDVHPARLAVRVLVNRGTCSGLAKSRSVSV